MSDKKISQLPASTVPLAGTEVLPIVQSGSTKQASVNSFFDRAVVVNESGADVDFRIESVNSINALFLDASAAPGRWGFNTDTPEAQLDIVNTSTTSLVVRNTNDGVKATVGASDFSTGSVFIGALTNHPVRLQQNNADALVVDTSKNVTVSTGNLVIGTAGKGLDFTGGVFWRTGTGSPEGVVTASVGSMYTNVAGGAGTTLYVKESGSGNTGWVSK